MKRIITVLCLTMLLSRCAMVGNVHSAKTLDPGVASVSLSVDGAGIMYSYSDSLQKADSTLSEPSVIPNATLLPNINFKMGVAENYELGVHFVPQLLGIEATVKHRFLQNGPHHVAAAPYFSFYLLKNYSAGAHGIYTYELSKSLCINMSAYSNFTYLDNLESMTRELTESMHFLGFGGIIGPQISGESVFFTPAFEYNIFIPLKENFTFMHVQSYRVSLTFGWYIGKVKRQLNRIEKKIDTIDRKLDNREE